MFPVISSLSCADAVFAVVTNNTRAMRVFKKVFMVDFSLSERPMSNRRANSDIVWLFRVTVRQITTQVACDSLRPGQPCHTPTGVLTTLAFKPAPL